MTPYFTYSCSFNIIFSRFIRIVTCGSTTSALCPGLAEPFPRPILRSLCPPRDPWMVKVEQKAPALAVMVGAELGCAGRVGHRRGVKGKLGGKI